MQVPPLRARRDQIEPLAREFAVEAARQGGVSAAAKFTAAALAVLRAHDWPGNIRELKNVIGRAVLLSNGGAIAKEHVLIDASPAKIAAPGGGDDELKAELREVERRRIVEALDACGGNQSRAAGKLGIARGTLVARIVDYGLARPRRK